ncbi:MAG: translation initiation factor IF-2 [Clostridiales bacterium]|nr:translation initiation factor IF-2 [Clostridiales bacterium]
MAKVTAKEVSQGAQELIKQLNTSREQLRELMGSLRARNDELFRARRAEQEEQNRKELKDRFDAAVNAINAAKNATSGESEPVTEPVQEAKPAPAEPARPQMSQRSQTTPQERPARTADAQPRPRPAYSAGPAQPGQRPPYGQQSRPQQGQTGARAAYPPRQQGQGAGLTRPAFGRPAAPGQQGQQSMQRPGFNRPQQGTGMQRPGGFGQRKPSASDMLPPVEKERVSNYDPKKNQYVRQNDPERSPAKNKRQVSRQAAPQMNMDDEFERGVRRKRKQTQAAAPRPEPVKIDRAVMTTELITVKDLSEKIGKSVNELIKKLLMLGIMATINNEIDYDTAQLICSDYGIELEYKPAETAESALEAEEVEDSDDKLLPRPPVVTVMGHVDHGKTSLLDYIRNTRVTAGEAGGITQHIGAYTVELNGKKITFLDTPGHEAFTAMRARGAQATDIAILVVAADDGVMPQTIEAINHAKAAGVQTIVAINKIDKPTADVERIRQELTKYDLLCEEWGGDTIMVPVSAKTGQGIDQLLEMVLLVAEVQDYRANPDRKARGIIIEARLDKGRGPVATVLIKNGTLKVGDTIVAGMSYGRVRAMVNDKGERVKAALPSDPVEVIGFNDVPEAGDIISAVDDDSLSRKVAEERRDKAKAALIKAQSKATLDDLFNQISEGQMKELNLIIKADVMGSVEAVTSSLEKLSNDEVKVRCIHGGVGAITETDVMLASASNAIIIGFNVRHDNTVRDIALKEKVDIRLYRVIYNAIEDVEAAMKGMLAPKYKENVLGRCQVRQTFKVSGVGTVAGCYVTDGKIQRNAQIRLLRDNVVIHEGKIDSLKRFKDDVREVATGYECGIGIENYNDVKVGDEMECFTMEEISE